MEKNVVVLIIVKMCCIVSHGLLWDNETMSGISWSRRLKLWSRRHSYCTVYDCRQVLNTNFRPEFLVCKNIR